MATTMWYGHPLASQPIYEEIQDISPEEATTMWPGNPLAFLTTYQPVVQDRSLSDVSAVSPEVSASPSSSALFCSSSPLSGDTSMPPPPPPPPSPMLTPDELFAIRDPWARIPPDATFKYLQTRLLCLPPNKILMIRLSALSYHPACRGTWMVPVTIQGMVQREDHVEVRVAWWAIACPLNCEVAIEQRQHLDYFEIHERKQGRQG